MSFLHWLQLLFIAFKLTGIIDWCWGYVIIPTILIILLAIIETYREYKNEE